MWKIPVIVTIGLVLAVACADVESAQEGPDGMPVVTFAARPLGEPTPLDSAIVRLGTSDATDRDLELVEAMAMSGDYQQQRNLANSLSQPNWWGKNEIRGCAWRLVILRSRSPQIDATDVANKRAFCDELLDQESVVAAAAQAEQLLRDVYGAR